MIDHIKEFLKLESAGGIMLVIVPVLFIVMVLAACWRASKRTRWGSAWTPPRRVWRSTIKPVRRDVQLMKTRAERYQDLKNTLGRVWR